MDLRKLDRFKRQAEESADESNIHHLINSSKIN